MTGQDSTGQDSAGHGSGSPHLDLDALADALAGEPVDDAHLGQCPECTARLAELEAAEAAVVASLAALPDPPLPRAVAERLTAALATVARSEGAPAAAAPDGATVTPLRPRRRAWAPGLAAALVLVLGGGLGYTALRSASPPGADSAATAGSAGGSALEQSAEGGTVRNASGIDYADPRAVTATLPRVLAGTATGDVLADADAAAPARQRGAGTPAPPAATADALTSTSGADPLARLRDPAGLASCLAALLPPDEPDVRPLALDYAAYRGAPALAVVLPDPDPDRLAVFVVGPQCSQADDRTLRFVRVPRP